VTSGKSCDPAGNCATGSVSGLSLDMTSESAPRMWPGCGRAARLPALGLPTGPDRDLGQLAA